MTQEQPAEAAPEVAQAIPEPTIEELRAYIAQNKTILEQYEKDLKSAKDEAKAHQKFGQEKVTELKNQSDLRSEMAVIMQELKDQREIAELQATAIAMGRIGDEEESQQVLQQLKARKQEQETQRQNEAVKKQQEADAIARQTYNQQADAVYSQAKTVFEGEDLTDIEDLLKSGNIILAKREVGRAVKSKTSVIGMVKETEEERVERLAEAKANAKMEAKFPGYLGADVGVPGGGVPGEGIPTDLDTFRKWISEMPQEEYEKKYASKVKEMMREGKIK